MATLLYRPLALEDLQRIYDFIAQDSPHHAMEHSQRIRRKARLQLETFPLIGLKRDDLAISTRMRPLHHSLLRAFSKKMRRSPGAALKASTWLPWIASSLRSSQKRVLGKPESYVCNRTGIR